jgi:very-short-patch-repair endonuclease
MVFIYYDGPRRISKARDLRRRQTKAEKTLWHHIRNRQLGDFKIDIEEHGFSVLRFKNDEVLFDLHRVLSTILSTLQNLPSSANKPLKHP